MMNTLVLSLLVYQQVVRHIPSGHVLACAPSNAAVDLLAERLREHIDKQHILRLHAHSRDPKTIPQSIMVLQYVTSSLVLGIACI